MVPGTDPEKCAFAPSTLIDNALVDDNPSTDLLTEDDFLNFFKAMPSIKHLELTTGWGPLLTENVMAYLMFRPGLEKLSMGAGSLLRYSTVRQALSENPDLVIFPHMRSLHVTAEDRALRLLLPLLKSLQSVEIDVDDCLFPVDIARYVSSCTRLEEIFYYWERGALNGASLVYLAPHCPMLRRVDFSPNLGYINDISDEMIEKLASKLVHLEALKLPPIGGRITSKSLASLARHCPRLRELTMPTDVEIIELDNEPEQLHFPSLQSLSLRRITARPLESKEDLAILQERIIQLLDKRFPSLTRFSFGPRPLHDWDSDPLTAKVREHLKQRSLPFSIQPLVYKKLTARLIESVPGSRYNPFS
ncbi:hypothetical protein M432DRAFT_340642 [Thermoascus aurantiacus ATCC 26904]